MPEMCIKSSLEEKGPGDEVHVISMEQQLVSIQDSRNHNNTEDNRYIYHSDHLGSSAFLTDANGIPTQHLQYLPFGEPFIEQRTDVDYYTPYTFSAKERDIETGYSYFGARYYNSHISVWLSVDPMSDKYPSMSAYMYCAGNPVILVDPDGRDWFQDEVTGDIYFNSEFSKENTKQVNEMQGGGTNYVWLGENGMFGKPDEQVLADNSQFADIISQYPCYGYDHTKVDHWGTEASFSGENAEKYMANMGFKKVISSEKQERKVLYQIHNEMDNTQVQTTLVYDKRYDQKYCYVPKEASSTGVKTDASPPKSIKGTRSHEQWYSIERNKRTYHYSNRK